MPWEEQSRTGTPGPWLHRLLPQQCRGTGGSLFITVFIVLGAACLVLGVQQRRKGSTQCSTELSLGCQGRAQSHSLGTARPFGILCCRWFGEGEHGCRQACHKHHNPKETFIGDSSATEQNMAFLTSSCAGAPTCAESPKCISSTSVYIHIHTSTSRDRDSSGS